ncbi:MAG: AraC family transcriptional regulator [Verrucomicrobia bacterium]|nr:AraC family transcriptional regulator [Verrucomicrobiota bacterium]
MNVAIQDAIALTDRLFEPLGDVVYCIKDTEGRYLAVNAAFVERVNLKSKEEVIGRTAEDLFAAPLVSTYVEQDAEVFETGSSITDRLERITNRDGSIGWYLASKHPIHDADGTTVVGLIGVSQDLHAPSTDDLKLSRLAEVVEHIHAHLDDPLRVDDLANLAGLSVAQFDRRMRKVFRLSAKQFVMKCRIEEASRLLVESDRPIGEIALVCGFSDQSAFTRQFKATTGFPPGEFRNQAESG